MGKRELLIVAIFVAVGALAYQLAAPPPTGTSDGFSFERVINRWRQRHNVALAHASVTTDGRLPVPPGMTTIRLSGLATVNVRGEARDDIAWTLTVEANGPDGAAADAAGRATVLRHEDLGGVLAVSVRAPDDTRQASTLALVVPDRLAVRVESARQTRVEGVSAVRLEGVVGDVVLARIGGAVDGGHRNGTLTIEDAGSVLLTLVASEAVVGDVRGASTINARNGTTRLERPRGPATLEINGQVLTVVEPMAEVRASGIGGEIRIEHARAPVSVDARRMHVALAVDRAVDTTVFGTETHVDLTIDMVLPVALDIVSESGTIDASAVGLPVTIDRGDSRLAHAAGDEARIAVRAQRGKIVIASGK